MPDPNAKGNTRIINETNVQVIGYAKDKDVIKEEKKTISCSNC